MKLGTQNEHKIDKIFPRAVFFVFAASALAVLMLAANLYSSQTANANNHYTLRTSLSYVNEKIHQNDTVGGISIQSLEGQPCLVLESSLNDTSYITYIYEYEGMLKELFARSDIEVHLRDGRDIMEVKNFTIDEMEDGLFRFTSVDSDGNRATLIASERSMP